jgi:regulator of protease activity HflC (stomatin/prohibitin superfamily)
MEMSVLWSARFRPHSAKLPDLHRNIGPGYAETVVVPEITSTMRRILGNYPAEELLAYAESAFMEQVATDTLKLFPDSPIIVEDILIHELLGPKG